MITKGMVVGFLFFAPSVFSSFADCSDGCKLSHQTIGATSFVVTVVWGPGGNSTPGICNPIPESPGHCDIALNCFFGAYSVTATGNGLAKWRNPTTGQWESKQLINGAVTKKFGDAANPKEIMCGNGETQVYLPDDLAGGGPLCTQCN